jgi:hypothetical protein
MRHHAARASSVRVAGLATCIIEPMATPNARRVAEGDRVGDSPVPAQASDRTSRGGPDEITRSARRQRAQARVLALGPLLGPLLTLVLGPAAGCYGGERAARDVNAAWRGRSRAALEAHWGAPAAVQVQDGATALRWSHTRRHVELPAAEAALTIEPGHMDGILAVQPGAVWHSSTEVVALLDAGGAVASVHGPSLRWGPPGDANLRWGTILGLHVGMGRLDDTSTPLPSGGMYIGGMLGPRLGLVGAFSLASGTDDAGGAMGFSWSVAAVWWPSARVSVRGGPALVLAFDPGFDDAALSPGLTGSASLALVRAGAFVLDLRVDITAAAPAAFGSLGVGVNLN